MERFANNASTTLNGAISDSDDVITVTSSTGFPTAGDFRVLIGEEYLKVTDVDGNDWSVDRGQEGSTAVAHSDGANVYCIVTKEAIDSVVSIQQSGTEIANRRILNFTGAVVTDSPGNNRVDIAFAGAKIGLASARPAAGNAGVVYYPTDAPMASIDDGSIWRPLDYPMATWPPVLSNWTVINAGSTSITDTPGGGINLLGPPESVNKIRGIVKSQSQPFTIASGFRLHNIYTNLGNAGLIINDGTKFVTFGILCYSPFLIQICYYSTWQTISSIYYSLPIFELPTLIWLRIVDSNSARSYEMSFNGIDWFVIKAEASGNVYLTANSGGFFINPNNSYYPANVDLIHWDD